MSNGLAQRTVCLATLLLLLMAAPRPALAYDHHGVNCDGPYCDGCSGCESSCDCSSPGWFGSQCGGGWCDNLSIFGGLEGSKQPQDFGVNAHFGGRVHANWGVPLSTDHGLGMQIGAAINATANAVQVVERTEGSKGRTQFFTTVGLFQRADCGFNWAVVYDYQRQNMFDTTNLGQWRGHFGYWCNPCTEIGIRAAISDYRDRGLFAGIPVVLDPITQGSVYGRRIWETGAATGFWAGIAKGHGEPNFALGDLARLSEQFVFGADVFCPLTDRLAIFGEANFIMPADTGTVDAYLGLAYFFGGTRRALRGKFAPVLPVANNTSMSVDLTR